jgi:hypothetical protein
MDENASEDSQRDAPPTANVRALVALRRLKNCAWRSRRTKGAVLHFAHRPYDFSEIFL